MLFGCKYNTLLTLMQYFSSIIFFKISLMPIYWLLWHLKIHDILPKITESRDVILTNWFIFNLKTNNLIICSLFRRLGNKLFLSVPFKVYFRNIGFTFDGTQRGAGIILTRLLQTDVFCCCFSGFIVSVYIPEPGEEQLVHSLIFVHAAMKMRVIAADRR